MVPDRLQPILDQVRPVAERFDAAGKCIYLVGGISTSSAASPAICWYRTLGPGADVDLPTDRADEVVAADFVDHAPMPGQAPGLEGVKRKWAMYLDAIPDFRVTIEDLVAEGDKVAVLRSYEGTHRGELLGIPATGKWFQFGGISIFWLANGRIAEHWEQLDRLALMQQLGVVPTPDARPARPATGESRR